MPDYVEELLKLAAADGKAATARALEMREEIKWTIRALQEQSLVIESVGQYLYEKYGEPDDAPLPLTVVEESRRSEYIKFSAIDAAKASSRSYINSAEVVEQLARVGMTLDVGQPNAVVGTVLSRLPEFKRVGANRFEHVGEPSAR